MSLSSESALSLLDDVRVLAIEQYGAGPFGSMHLADLGAEIIKIEDRNAGGDVARQVSPYATNDGDSLFFQSFNRNKRSISLDMKNPAGRKVFEQLVARSDVVYSNLRGDVPARLRIRYEDLEALNPRIVCVSLSAFGTEGPRSHQPGYDYILQALTGWMDLTGEPDGLPTKSALSLVDYCGGLIGAIAILAGVHGARRTGVGMDFDLSLYDTALAMLTYPATWLLTEGWKPSRVLRSAHPSLVPFQLFEGSDGEWFVLGCGKEHFWSKAAAAIGRHDLLDDPRFKSFPDRDTHREALIAALDSTFATRPAAEWVTLLEHAEVPVAPVNDLSTAISDEHTAARELITEFDHPEFGTIRQIASPFRVNQARPGARRAPRLNEDENYVLRDVLGFEDNAISTLRGRGAFG